MNIIEKIESEQIKKKAPDFKVGDSVKVSVRVREGEKERVQAFAGIVIARQGRGVNEAFTVRRISYGEGVERVFPLHSPFIEDIKVEKPGRVRRAKLYYLRGQKGAMSVKTDVNAIQKRKAEKATEKKTSNKKNKKKTAEKV
ncbi:MAG: 50S ribosomal protein L19 [Candidatus Methylacidiphilales bacterium]